MESIDDPLTDSQKPSANTTLPPLPPTSTTSQQLHPNPGPAKTGSNTSSYRAPRAPWRKQGLITQPDLGKPGSDCLRERARPRTLDKRLAVNHFPPPPGSSLLSPALCRWVKASTSSPLYLPAL
ncbi:hypothetical protein OYC64_007095 [Pagothenia borchgrevinki]|uniref:Uncharacterized protein n=1 Tax=Pagothenia borchgrevinki TaxID=8213 RepID=A0ABD2G3U1_PAGBO